MYLLKNESYNEIVTKLSLYVAHVSLGDTTNDEYNL